MFNNFALCLARGKRPEIKEDEAGFPQTMAPLFIPWPRQGQRAGYFAEIYNKAQRSARCCDSGETR